jgi:hypothetical protein
MTAIEEAAKRLRFPDGGRARLLLNPKALPYRVPGTTWSSPRGGTWSPTSPGTPGSTGPGCTVGRRPTGRSGPGRAGGALGPRVLSYKGGLRWTSL